MTVIQWKVKLKANTIKHPEVINDYEFNIMAANLSVIFDDITIYKRENSIFKIFEISIRRVD